MLASITRRQLYEWMEYDQLEPFGEERADLRMGILAATMLEPHRDPKRRSSPFAPEEFMPDFDRAGDKDGRPRDADQMTEKQIENSFRMLSSMGHGTFTPAA